MRNNTNAAIAGESTKKVRNPVKLKINKEKNGVGRRIITIKIRN